MAERRESVRLELIDSGFSTGMVKSAAATGLLERALKSLDGTNVVIHERISESSTQVDRLSKSSRDADRSINQLTGRLSLLADAVAILGPGLVPIAAVAVPAVTGLAAQFGFAATAGAGFVVAIQGMGDALEAMNKAHLEPTTENLAAARVAMENLSPAGQDLARQLFGLRDEWRRLRDVSQGALFPGLSEAIDDFETRLPDVERILVNVNRAVGEMLADGAESLASPRWDRFFDFIATDAPPALASMGRALGDVAHAMTVMWRAFDPLNDSFGLWLEDSANALDEWAKGLSRSAGFQEFVDYIRENGPQVADTLGEVALAVVRIGEAAAPLGGPVLQALESVAEAIGTIAGSDAGPSIMATVTALALLRRGMALFDRGSQVAWVQSVKGAETFGQKVAAARSPLLRTTAAMSGLAIASSGVADGMLGSNAATGALLGTMGGPWGAAIGGAVGLMLDLTSTTGGFEVNAQALTETLDQQTGAITENTTAFAANELEKQGVLKAAQALGLSLSDVTQASLGNADALARVTSGLDAAKAGFYNADGSIAVSSNTLTEYGERSNLVKEAIGNMSGELETGQSRVRRMADATDAGTAAYNRAETAAQDFANAVTKLNNVLSGRAAMRDYEAAIDDFTKSLKENGRTFDINTEKGRNNQAALDGIATTAIKVAEGMKGADRQRFLTAAIKDLREAGNKFDVPKAQTRDLIALLKEANNARVSPKVDTGPVLNAIAIIRKALKDIPDESVIVRVTRSGTGAQTPGFGPVGSADGSTVPKTGKPYADRHLYLLADGEEVISNRHGQADKWRPMLKAINGGLADGGTSGKRPKASGGVFVFDNTDRLERAIERLTRVSEDQTQAVEDQTRRTEEWASRMSEVAAATVSGFNTGLFERDSNVWAAGAGGGWMHNLTRDIAGLNERGNLQQQLGAAGLSGDALAALLEQGSNADISGLLASGQVSQYASLYAQRAALQGSVGASAGQMAFGSQYAAAQAAQNAAVAEQQATNLQLIALNTRLERMEKALANAPELVGAAAGGAVVRGGNQAARRRRRD